MNKRALLAIFAKEVDDLLESGRLPEALASCYAYLFRARVGGFEVSAHIEQVATMLSGMGVRARGRIDRPHEVLHPHPAPKVALIRRPHHHLSRTGTYRTWCAMIQRCTQAHCKSYPYYGGRGITVCDRWRDFRNFLADMGERPNGSTLDRIDYDGNYEPTNCRWATPLEQARNRRLKRRIEVDGRLYTHQEVCRLLEVNRNFVHYHIAHGRLDVVMSMVRRATEKAS